MTDNMKTFDEIYTECGDETVDLKVNKFALHEDYPEHEEKLAHLLIEGVIFLNNGWHDPTWPKDKTTLHINCNDVFAWGCADAEDIDYSEIPKLYEMWKQNNTWGSAVFCIMKRGMKPQKPVYDAIQALNIWDLDNII